MKKKLFVSNLDFDITEDQLKEMFEGVGQTVSVVLAVERESKRSKGFAFVEMESEELAKNAIEELHEKTVNGRPIRVSEDRGKGGDSGGGKGSEPGERRQREHLPPIQRMQLFRRRQKVDPFIEDPSKVIDFRDTALLGRFMSERGKILSRRLTGLTAYNQRQVAKAIKRAQSLGLLPYRN